jgi:hypothetical protein
MATICPSFFQIALGNADAATTAPLPARRTGTGFRT